jgi:hypothetical protein
MARDVIDMANNWESSGLLLLEAYTLATLFPERVRAIATLALAYQPRGEFHRDAPAAVVDAALHS